MGITAKNTGGGDYDPIPEGMHHSICYGVYDLGKQYNERWNKTNHQVLIQWELPEIRIDIDREDKSVNLPRAISRIYNLSLHQKSNLRHDLESWRSRSFTEEELEGFDLTKLLSANCNINVGHNKKDNKVYANILSIVPLMKGQERRQPENNIRYFSFEEEMSIPENTPEWIVDIIHNSTEYEKSTEEIGYSDENPFDSTMEDDIPF